MKKYMISILMLCLGYAGMSKAANTDISTLSNIIYVEPFSVAKGTQVQMSLKMKNTVAIRGFQFDLFLPEGVTAAKSGKGKILASLTASRLPDEDEHTLTVSEQTDGSIRFLCGSLYDETFTGTDGEVATLTIDVAAGMSDGDYPVYLKNMKLTETDISHYYETSSIETTLTVGATAFTILNETSTTAPVAATGVNVRVMRTINADEWSTICLPFAMSETQVKTAFGNDVALKAFNGYVATEEGDDVVGITVNFNDATAIEANHPCLIKVSSAVSQFDVEGVDIAPEDEPKVAAVNRTKKQRSEMIGTYKAQTAVPEDCLFLNGNKFYYSSGSTKTKAFRAYFDFYDVLSDVENASRSIVMGDGGTTGLKGVNGEDLKVRIYYDLNGHRVENPSKGVYIVNGRKVIVK